MTKDTFVLGSGFSKDIANLPVLDELSEKVIDYLDSFSDKRTHFYTAKTYIENSMPSAVQENIELLMTALRGSNPWLNLSENSIRQSFFSTITEIVSNVLTEEQSKWHDQRSEKDLCTKELLKIWTSKKANVISFNYDTIIEQLMFQLFPEEPGSLKRDYFSGGDLYVGALSNVVGRTSAAFGSSNVGKFFRLIKLHGSINWYYSGNENFSGEPIYFDPSEDHNNGYAWEQRQDLTPMIIPPVLDKDPFMQHSLLRLQWAEAYKSLATSDNVYIIGYSLPETDLVTKFMFQEALYYSHKKHNTKWHILLYGSSDKEEKRYRQLAPSAFFYNVPHGESSIKFLYDLVSKK